MKIISEPLDIATQVLRQQKRKASTSYRLMHYVIQQEVEGGVLLYNTLTCCMVMITDEEAKRMTETDGLVENWFLVPENHDDKKLCNNLKAVVRLVRQQPKGIRKYTIVTTTGCNARCFYCFEKGTKPANMKMETAEKVAQFIISHRGEYKKVQIDWFGGEPLYNFKVMDRICTRLKESDVEFFSRITSNAYLFNEKMVERARLLWNLKSVLITLDGMERNYNRIKAYIHPGDQSPFLRVMNNIRMLHDASIRTIIRLHVSNENVQEMESLIKMLSNRFKDNGLLKFQIYHLFELFGPEARILSSEERIMLLSKIRYLEDYLVELKIRTPKRVDKGIFLNQCMVDSGDAVMIVPDGHLGLCEHHLESRFFGQIDSDEWDLEVIKQSRLYCEEIPECDTCPLYPACIRLKICIMLDMCFKESRDARIADIQQGMLNKYRMLSDSSCEDYDEKI